MSWDVLYSAEAQEDLQNIFDYISFILCAPDSATNQATRIMDAVDSLSYMPFRYRLYDSELWKSYGLRFFPVDNYLIFYSSDESTQTVTIIRIMYKGRNIDKQLHR